MPMQLPPAGTRLISRRHRGRHRGEFTVGKIVDDSNFPGGRAVDVDGVRYSTLSAAAKAVSGHETNGWVWWHLEDGRPVADLRKR